VQPRASPFKILKGSHSITSFWQRQELAFDLSMSISALFSRVY